MEDVKECNHVVAIIYHESGEPYWVATIDTDLTKYTSDCIGIFTYCPLCGEKLDV